MGMRQVTIRPVLNGWVVAVGCQEVVFSDRRQLMTELDRYLEHPDVEEKKWVTGAINFLNDVGPTTPTTDTNRFLNLGSVAGTVGGTVGRIVGGTGGGITGGAGQA